MFDVGCWMFPSPNLSALRWATLRWLAGLILALLAGVPGLAFGQTGIPNIINYQGKLTDNLGNPVPAGPYQVTFKIWDSPTSPNDANYIWGCSLPVHVVTNGMFNVLLTDGVKIGNPKINQILQAFEGDQRFLGLTITRTPDGDVPQTEISPRQRLVSAPFAIHTYNASFASQASNSITASNAAFASYAYYATNAGKFSSFTTNDFLLVNKTAQTLTGSLTISNGNLTLKSNLLVNGDVTASSNLTISGHVGIGTTSPNYQLSFANDFGDKISLWGASGPNYGFGVQSYALQIHSGEKLADVVFGYGSSTNLTETFRIKGTGDIKVAGTNPIVIQQFWVSNITALATNQPPFNTRFETNVWTAVIAGFTFDADVMENGIKKPYLRVRMVPYESSTHHWTWGIDYFLAPEEEVSGIKIDVMFIRRELAADMRFQ